MTRERARELAASFGYDRPKPPTSVFVPLETYDELREAGLLRWNGAVDWDALAELGEVRRHPDFVPGGLNLWS